jgi:hypothetical protein
MTIRLQANLPLSQLRPLRAVYLSSLRLGNDPRDRTPVAGNHQGFAKLHLVEKLGEVGLGFRGLNFAHGGHL